LRVLIAPQEFKGTLSASEAADAIARGLRSVQSDWQLEQAPMADGGPGTVEALISGRGGELRRVQAHDPLMRPVEATWGLLENGTGVVECAAASGLWRLRPDELDPRRASSYGTGELIGAALDAGCRELIVGLGGSATNDGGAGMARALGFRLLDVEGRELPPGGAALSRLAGIEAPARYSPFESLRVSGYGHDIRVFGATDVTNPLCGPQGASAVYGPQKGADPDAIRGLDAALDHFAAVLRRDLGADVRDVPGAGAAGGLGAGLLAFLGAELQPGAAVVASALGLEERVRAANVIITGEGRLDGQTAFGKAPQYVAQTARTAVKPVLCLAGSLGPGYETVVGQFDVVESCGTREMKPADALADAAVRAMLRLLARSGQGLGQG
jgi:glycerate kinase